MFKVILRRICVGFGALVLATVFGLFVVAPVTLYFISKPLAAAGGAEVGWDLVSMAGALQLVALAALLVFAAGSYFGFRHFSELSARR